MLMRRLMQGARVEMTAGEQLRNYLYVRDLADYLVSRVGRLPPGWSEEMLRGPDNLS
jgi:hypothetical protein